jgi:hypothetical protein
MAMLWQWDGWWWQEMEPEHAYKGKKMWKKMKSGEYRQLPDTITPVVAMSAARFH